MVDEGFDSSKASDRPLDITETENRGFNFSIVREPRVLIEKYYENSFAVHENGRLINDEFWASLTSSELIDSAIEISRLIEGTEDIKAFATGSLDFDSVKGEEVLAHQYQNMLRALKELIFARRLTEEDVGKILDYVYDTDTIKPFLEAMTSVIFNVILAPQRDILYSAMATRKKSLAEATDIIDKFYYGGFIMLESEPQVGEVAEHFSQTEEEAEKHIVADNKGRYFLLKGIRKDRGVITYRYFPDIAADFHTHRVDYPFSRRDIIAYKRLGLSKDIYGIESDEVAFFVCSPSGLWKFEGNLAESLHDNQQDRKNDSLRLRCRVINEDLGEEASFDEYTNHNKGKCGRHIQAIIEKGVSKARVVFENGDNIQFTSWKELERQGRFNFGVSSLTSSI